MTSRVIKVQSRQNHPITSSKNLIDFDIPSGMYDLSKSYLNLNVELPSKVATNISLMNLNRVDGSGSQDDNISFVRHASMRSLKHGSIENNRHINVLKHNLKTYEESVSKQACSEIMSKLSCSKDENDLSGSNYRTVNKTGSTLSSDKAHNHIIRLKDILNFCKNSYYDTEDKGDLEVHLEMDVENVQAFQQVKANDPWWTKKYGSNTAANGAIKPPAATGTTSTITTKRAFYDLHESPFYVGMGVTITGSGLASNPTTTQVMAISVNADKEVELTLAATLNFTGLTDDVTVKSVTEGTPTNSPTFNYCELVLHQLEQKQTATDYQYTTYHLQEDTVNTSSLNKNYFVSGMCKNVFVITPASGTDLRSSTVVNSYRTSVDNVYDQNRLIDFSATRDPLHLSQVMKCWDNRDEVLTNARGLVARSDKSQVNPFGADLISYMVCQPVPITAGQKMIGLEINTAAAMGKIMIYEEVLRKL